MAELPDAPPTLRPKDDLRLKDKRISYDQESDRWIYETNENESPVQYHYDFTQKAWVKDINDKDNSLEINKRGYDDSDVEKEEEENKKAIKRLKKEKLDKMRDEMYRQRKNNKRGIEHTEQDQIDNTGIFISHLPGDVTREELKRTFSKFGMISEDYKTGEPRIKLYHDENGNFKREALIIYHGPESVQLAIDMLDYSTFSTSNNDSNEIRVQPADFSAQGRKSKSSAAKKALSAEEKHLLSQKRQSMSKKLSTWDDDDSSVAADHLATIKQKIFAKMIVIENMFKVAELHEDPTLEIDIKEDIQEECDKINIGNDITKITLFDTSGVVTVKFMKPESSHKCIDLFNGRYYDGSKLVVRSYQGEKFESSRSDNSVKSKG